jgi:hypothetical protein
MLPKLDVPIYEVKLISTGKPIRFRPFLVREQKLFLMAAESEDPKETVNVIRQVLKNCILDEIDIDGLPTFDLEYIFMHMRARSVEEIFVLALSFYILFCHFRVVGSIGVEAFVSTLLRTLTG